ncbi:hypothetical protein ES705_13916 [subsurface metagenome]
MFPHGFYYGFDYVPSIGFRENRETNEKVLEPENSADIIAGYSGIKPSALSQFLQASGQVDSVLFVLSNPKPCPPF